MSPQTCDKHCAAQPVTARRATSGRPAPRAVAGVAAALVAVPLASGGLEVLNRHPRLRLQPEELQLRIDPNCATAAELRLLPRVGPAIADNIVAYREASPDRTPFRRAEDLDRVPRIGPATVEQLRPYLKFPNHPDQRLSKQDSP
jgi:competence ComEA-like helix-hairpin-helix protein